MSYQLLQGDCLEKLTELADNSVDSIVTDPPYGLSDNKSAKRLADLVRRFFNVVLPNFEQSNTKPIKYFHFAAKPFERTGLRGLERFCIIEPWVSMPERAVHLNSDVECGQEEIQACAVATGKRIAEPVLMNEFNPSLGQHIGDYVLDFRDAVDSTGSYVGGGDFGELSQGSFTMPIGAIAAAAFPYEDANFTPTNGREGVNNLVSLCDDPGSNALTPGFVLTSGGTEAGLMLRFDLARAAGEFSATITTCEVDAHSLFKPPLLVRAFAAASELATKLEPCRVGFIAYGADGTISNYFLHVWLPKRLLSNIRKIADSSSGFMGKKWDYDVPSEAIWRECLRVLKPGGYLLAFGGSRTYHRMAVRVEDAGFELRDQIMWLFGSGFPKNANAQLKPAHEPIVLARKPFAGSASACVAEYGTGYLRIDACRIPMASDDTKGEYGPRVNCVAPKTKHNLGTFNGQVDADNTVGRWPANVLHDGSEEVLAEFAKSGETVRPDLRAHKVQHVPPGVNTFGDSKGVAATPTYGDTGTAARFFYCAKASPADREKGNHHPTVKPTDLMRYLCRLVTPVDGTVLDPFAGSGSTGKAALLEGLTAILIEREPEYWPLIHARCQRVLQRNPLRF